MYVNPFVLKGERKRQKRTHLRDGPLEKWWEQGWGKYKKYSYKPKRPKKNYRKPRLKKRFLKKEN